MRENHETELSFCKDQYMMDIPVIRLTGKKKRQKFTVLGMK